MELMPTITILWYPDERRFRTTEGKRVINVFPLIAQFSFAPLDIEKGVRLMKVPNNAVTVFEEIDMLENPKRIKDVKKALKNQKNIRSLLLYRLIFEKVFMTHSTLL